MNKRPTQPAVRPATMSEQVRHDILNDRGPGRGLVCSEPNVPFRDAENSASDVLIFDVMHDGASTE
jgi:hypothetical protein